MTQLNTPYPATAYLTGFLKKQGFNVAQADPALELVLRLFCRKGLTEIGDLLRSPAHVVPGLVTSRSLKKLPKPFPSVEFFLAHEERYISTIDAVIRFLQGKNSSLALRIVTRDFLPEGPRFAALQEGVSEQVSEAGSDPLSWAFGVLGVQDRAKYLASLYIDDLADVVRQGIDPKFELSRYGEKLAASVPTFDPLREALESSHTLVDQTLEAIVDELIELHQPDVVGLTAPFPGNVYGAFRIAQRVRTLSPQTRILLGGGYVNTELRQVSDVRVFDFFDFITLDDGERPFLTILEHLKGERPQADFLRTFVREGHEVVLKSHPRVHDIPHRDTGTPSYEGLTLDRYLSIFEMLNPTHRIWSDGRWNKLTLAHGCYWKKCSFCDVSLDYIGRYDPASADLIVDRIEAMIAQTGEHGFHFVDEAAPPAVLRALAERLIARKVVITWWGNFRFEKVFTPEFTQLLARSGCVAITGGLEVASDRLLKLMKKGVTVEQVARVTRAFTDAGIMVHAYLMYGFPTQTEQETLDALEQVRQLFAQGCIQSAYWHRFSVTAHSEVGQYPERFGIRLLPEPEVTFARNDLAFEDPTGCDHDFLGEGLRKAVYNYMHGVGLDLDVRFWFGKKGSRFRVPAPRVSARLVEEALA
jgi:radical SAM superfamily enzyme YgiQ (UPF0313 family)